MTAEDRVRALARGRVRTAQIRAAAALAVVGVMLAGCGASHQPRTSAPPSGGRTGQPSSALASRVCGVARQAAAQSLNTAVTMQIADPDAAYLECVLDAGKLALDVVAQAIPQARSAYDTAIVHYTQNYGEPGEAVRDPTQLPRNLSGVGTGAAWVPGPHRLLATNGTLNRGGNFLSITVTPVSTADSRSLALARAVAAATLAAAPRGPDLRSDY